MDTFNGKEREFLLIGILTVEQKKFQTGCLSCTIATTKHALNQNIYMQEPMLIICEMRLKENDLTMLEYTMGPLNLPQSLLTRYET